MRIVVAADSFKGCLTAVAAGEAIKAGILRAYPDFEVVNLPVADGGEGTVAAMVCAAGGRTEEVTVKGPMGDAVGAKYGILPNGEAVIEMAAASGITLLGSKPPDAAAATTYGTGQLIRAALDAGCSSILIGLGGSATTDGGAGMAQALGASLTGPDGRELGPGGAELLRLADIDVSGLDPRLRDCRITAACDVTNPLCGERGASAVFAPQKGAGPETVLMLDAALGHYARMLKKCLGADVAEVPGSGAAGGLGAGLMAFCGAKISSGIETVLDHSGFSDKAAGAALVITGEGRLDFQTACGKAPAGVARYAKKAGNIPVIAIAGGIGEGARDVLSCGIDAYFSIAPGPVTLEYSRGHAGELLADTAEAVIRTFISALK